MDGNRRWARENGVTYEVAYNRGADVLKAVVERAIDLGIANVTVYAFSTENWHRPKIEVDLLMRLFQYYLAERVHELHEKNVRFLAVGRLQDFPASLQQKLRELMELTAKNTAITLRLALNYGGRAEIVDAVNVLLARGEKTASEERLQRAMYDPEFPPVDLVVRTSGEQRTSGFLLWHAHYAELYFLQKNWPDLQPSDVDAAVAEYQKRKRNFGA